MPFSSRFMAEGRFGSLLQGTRNWGNRPFLPILLLTTITAAIKSTAILTSALSPAPVTLPSPIPLERPSRPPSPAPKLHCDQQQINNIIDALIGAGHFDSWADILSAADAIPSTITIELFVFLYHIVPHRLSFLELCLLKPLSRLPALFPSKTILITSNSLSNFTINDRLLSRPDLYTTHSVAVHGIASLLDYSVYGDGLPTSLPTPRPPSPPSPPGILTPPGIDQLKSNALRFDTRFWIVFLVVLGALLV